MRIARIEEGLVVIGRVERFVTGKDLCPTPYLGTWPFVILATSEGEVAMPINASMRGTLTEAMAGRWVMVRCNAPVHHEGRMFTPVDVSEVPSPDPIEALRQRVSDAIAIHDVMVEHKEHGDDVDCLRCRLVWANKVVGT